MATIIAGIAVATMLSNTWSVGKEQDAAVAKADALYEQARGHLRGEGMAKDVDKAFALMNEAAALGHAEAMGGVGYFHAAGIVVPKDDAKAVEWFRKGAENGGAKSGLNLGKMLIAGTGTAVDVEEGRRWMESAAARGLPEAMMELAHRCYSGSGGFSADKPKALAWYLKAAEIGELDAMNAAGVMFKEGDGVAMEPERADELLRRAARLGHAKAQSNLGQLLGPIGQDEARRIEALAWLLLAAAQDEITASKMLADVTPGTSEKDMEQARKLANTLRREMLSNALLKKP